MEGRHIVHSISAKKMRMTFHSLDGPEDRKPLIVALFYGKLAGPVTRIDLDLSSYDVAK